MGTGRQGEHKQVRIFNGSEGDDHGGLLQDTVPRAAAASEVPAGPQLSPGVRVHPFVNDAIEEHATDTNSVGCAAPHSGTTASGGGWEYDRNTSDAFMVENTIAIPSGSAFGQEKPGCRSSPDAGTSKAQDTSPLRASGDLRDPLRRRADPGCRRDGCSRAGSGQPMNAKATTTPTGTTSTTSSSSTTTSSLKHVRGKAANALLTTVLIFCTLPDAAAKFSWLGPRLEATDESLGKDAFLHHHTFVLGSSTQELARTDFDGAPAVLTRAQRHFVQSHIKNFLEDVGEVYSPPRVTAEAKKRGLSGSIALDLTTGWDFKLASHREEARSLVKTKKPGVLLLSPPCTTYSPLRRLTNYKRHPWEVQQEEQEGDLHMDYAVSLAEDRGFILEHPANATSWVENPRLQQLLKRPDVFVIYLDMCRFNLRAAKGPVPGALAKKPTLLATNIEELGHYVERSCDKSHDHGPLIGGGARQAAIYTPEFVKALVDGIKETLGYKTMNQHSKHEPPRKVGRALGALAFTYAKENMEIEQELETLATMPVTFEEDQLMEEAQPAPRQPPEDDIPPFDVEAAVRSQLRNVSSGSRVSEALQTLEDFQKVNEDEFALAPQLRREVHRVHRNLGHPSKDIFLRALKHAGVRTDIIDWTKAHYRCPVCEARQRPTPARPGHLMRALEFNTVVGMDLFFMELFGKTYTFLNVLCWGTNFLQVDILETKASQEVLDTFLRLWVQHYGAPVLLVVDRGREFFSQKFVEAVASLGVGIHFTDPGSPWQNSRTEKAGGLVKEKLAATLLETSASPAELKTALAEVVAARNRFMDRFGFSPMQRVFGKNLRLPASLLSTDALDHELTELSANEQIQRVWSIREAAAKEWMKRQDRDAVRRSVRAKTRTSDMKKIPPRTWIYVYRDSPSYRGWTGPGVYLADDVTNRSAWVSMRGRLWKASLEQIRRATPEEELGAELVVELSKELMDKLQQPGQVVYQDVTAEGHPEDDEFPEDAVRRVLRITEDTGQADRPEPPPPSSAESTHLGSEENTLPDTATVPGTADHSRRASMEVETEEPFVPEPMETITEDQLAATPMGPPPVAEGPRVVRVDEGTSGTMTFGPARTSSSSSARRSTLPYHAPETPPVGWTPPRAPYPFDQGAPSLPKPPGESFFMEVIDFERNQTSGSVNTGFIGATWKYSREQGERVLQPRDPTSSRTFTADHAEASFCERDRCIYVTKAKTSFGQVEFSKLAEDEKKLFREARKKELDSLVTNGAVKVMSVEESRAFLKEFPDQVIDSRFVDRYKPKELDPNTISEFKRRAIQEGHMEAVPLQVDQRNPKSRWCVVGWQDPDVLEVERSSPTPLSTSIYTCLQLAASRKWKTHIKDVKTAFLQGRPTTRTRRLACRQPRDEALPGLHPEQLLLLETEVYGLVSGPSWWRRSLLGIAEQLGYKICPYDRCVLTLPGEKADEMTPTDGFMVIEVDDIAEAGNDRHRAKMEELHKLLKFGKIEALFDSNGSSYAGRQIKQNKDYSFEMNMEEFIYTRLEPIKLSRRVLKKDAASMPLNEAEKTQLRGLIASLNWIAREARPDASAAASLLASAFPSPSMSHILSANDIVAHLKTFPVTLKVHAIKESKLRNILISDSAFDTSGKERSQHGWLLGFTDDTMNRGALAPVSLMQWRSKRLRRKASSSLLCEAISMSAATAALERQDAMMEAISKSHFNPRRRQRNEDDLLELAGKATVIASQSGQYMDPKSLVLMDAKSLYDSLNAEQAHGDDERSALEVAIIKESLAVTSGRPRWLPHNHNSADALTKIASHSEPLLKLLQTNHFSIEEETTVLERGRQHEDRRKSSLANAARSARVLGADGLKMETT